jgi:UDP-glucuronate decarboxylase
LIKELTQSSSEIKFLPATKDDPKQRRPDITVAKTNIDWSPEVHVRDGLAKAIEYFKKVTSTSILIILLV